MAKTKSQKEEPLERKLWKTADKLRKNIDAAEYKHIVLGLIFLKYISDAFEDRHADLVIANLHFNDRDWSRDLPRKDGRGKSIASSSTLWEARNIV